MHEEDHESGKLAALCWSSEVICHFIYIYPACNSHHESPTTLNLAGATIPDQQHLKS